MTTMNKTPAPLAAKRRRALSLAALVPILALTLAACPSHPAATATSNQSRQNNLSGTISTEFDSRVPYPFANCDISSGSCTQNPPSDPLELKNLAARLRAYNSAGDTNYVYLFAWGSPTPIGYYVTRGKVSSTGSQMTSTDVNVTCNGSASCTNLAPGDDGSYGPDEGGQNGVFFFTATGTLIETDQPFVVSSAPIKLYASVPQLDAPASK